MTDKQINATIEYVRAEVPGDPASGLYCMRGHLAIVLGELDRVRARLARAEAVCEALDVYEQRSNRSTWVDMRTALAAWREVAR